jgi:uncharacterized protein (DUF1684 family)
MKTKSVLIILVVIVLIITFFYSFQSNEDHTSYLDEILKEREEKDRFMRTSDQSPFASSRQNFKGLNYFPPDPAYRIIADLHPITKRNVVVLHTNDGKEERYIEYAYAEFDFGNVHNKLLILEVMDMGPFRGKLFLAFGDETSALETYGAGRYLDLIKTPGSQTITLDFNKAYNPYCAYNNTYSCTLPPRENLLKISIKAGEKSYH